MPVYSRKELSGTVNGLIGVSATVAANAQIIHQVQNTSTSAFECVWLKVSNRNTVAANAVVVRDSATATGQQMKIFLGGRLGGDNEVNLFQGLPLTGTDTILRAYWATTDTQNLIFEGYYNEIATG